MTKKKLNNHTQLINTDNTLLNDIKNLIQQTKNIVITTANSSLVMLHWNIGKRIQDEVLKNERAEYGSQVISNLAEQLRLECGKGFSKFSLSRMITFYNVFTDKAIVAALSQQLSWSHFVELIPLSSGIKVDFYTELCRIERWSTRTLRDKIQGMLFERTAISKKPEETIKQTIQDLREKNKLTPALVLRDPYLLEFLELEDTYSEKDLEQAILRDLEKFLLELGGDFTFMARQKRISIGNDDYYIDLLFFHRSLKRIIALELKLGKFQAADKGQMELYLRWLDKNEKKEGESPPLGIVLCADKNDEQIELLELHQSGIHVAQYLTQLPAEEILRERLHKAIERARFSSNIENR